MKKIEKSEEEIRGINEDSRKLIRDYTLIGIMFFTFVSNIIPILGPSTIAGIAGYRKRYNQRYGLNNVNLLIAMIVGELFCLTIIFALIRYEVNFPKLWVPAILGFVINSATLTWAYFTGVKKSKQVLNGKNSNHWFSVTKMLFRRYFKIGGQKCKNYWRLLSRKFYFSPKCFF
jgi:hypothetical protein